MGAEAQHACQRRHHVVDNGSHDAREVSKLSFSSFKKHQDLQGVDAVQALIFPAQAWWVGRACWCMSMIKRQTQRGFGGECVQDPMPRVPCEWER